LSEVRTYPFDESFQLKILSVIAKDRVFATQHIDAINPLYFKIPECAAIASLLKNHLITYHTIPDRDTLITIIDDTSKQLNWGDDVTQSTVKYADYVHQLAFRDSDYVKNKILQFAMRSELIIATSSIVTELLESTDPDVDLTQARSYIDNALKSGASRNQGYDVSSAYTQLSQMLAEDGSYKDRIPTGFNSIDSRLLGGMGRGTFNIIIGPPGIGKSTSLVNFGYGAYLAGYKVLHFTFELKQIDVLLKYLSRHHQIPINDFVANPALASQVYENAPILNDRIRTLYMSPGRCDAAALRMTLSIMQSSGFCPDLVILDYIKKMKYDRTNAYAGLGSLTDDLIAVSDDYNFANLTGQQTRREFRFADITEIDGVSDSYTLVENADIAIAISQTQSEHQGGYLRYELGKVRRGADAVTVNCTVNYATGTILERSGGGGGTNAGVTLEDMTGG